MHVKGVGFGVYVTITTSGAGPENVTIGAKHRPKVVTEQTAKRNVRIIC